MQILDDYDLLVAISLVDTYADDLQNDINFVLLLAIGIIILVLAFASKSWGELPVFLLIFGVAALLNMGTNYWFGTISGLLALTTMALGLGRDLGLVLTKTKFIA